MLIRKLKGGYGVKRDRCQPIVFADEVFDDMDDWLSPRQARALAAGLIREAEKAESAYAAWKFKQK